MSSKDCKKKKLTRNRASSKDVSKEFPSKKVLIASIPRGQFQEDEPVESWRPAWEPWK